MTPLSPKATASTANVLACATARLSRPSWQAIPSGWPLPTTGTQILSSQRNVYNHNQSLVRIDHSFSQNFSIFGRFLYDSIPTTEPGGLFTGSSGAFIETSTKRRHGGALWMDPTRSS